MRILLMMGLTLLAACGTSQKTLVISTVPEGATLVEVRTGRPYLSPVSLTYKPDPAYTDKNGCLHVSAYTAVWSSGVRLEATAQTIALCGEHSFWNMTLRRPEGKAGLEEDLAAERARHQMLRQEKLAREIKRREIDAAMVNAMGNLGESLGCLAGGGCSRNRRPTYYDPVEPRRSVSPPPLPNRETPPWARKRDPLELEMICDVDGYGRSQCGLKE